jgi:hypothetical protein
MFAGYSVYVAVRALSDRARLLLRARADRNRGGSN